MYIHQKDSIYYVLNTEPHDNDLYQHPAMLNYPQFFEVVEGEIPSGYVGFIFQEPEE